MYLREFEGYLENGKEKQVGFLKRDPEAKGGDPNRLDVSILTWFEKK